MLTMADAERTAESFISQSVGPDGELPQAGYTFQIEGALGSTLVGEWEAGARRVEVTAGDKIQWFELETWLGGLAYACNVETGDAEIDALTVAIENRLYRDSSKIWSVNG